MSKRNFSKNFKVSMPKISETFQSLLKFSKTYAEKNLFKHFGDWSGNFRLEKALTSKIQHILHFQQNPPCCHKSKFFV